MSWLCKWHARLVWQLRLCIRWGPGGNRLLCRKALGVLSSHSVNQVDAQPLGILEALGVHGRHKQVQVVRAAAHTAHGL